MGVEHNLGLSINGKRAKAHRIHRAKWLDEFEEGLPDAF
jgi:hypothetical protein